MSTLASDVPAADGSERAERAFAGEAGSRAFGLFAKLVGIGFWGTLAVLIVSAAVTAAAAILFMLPLLGMGYVVFCLIAWYGDRDVE